MAATHYLARDKVHFTWDVRHEPAGEIESGDVVIVRTRDVSDDQITPASSTATLSTLDWKRVYPLAGPVAVRGARPVECSGNRRRLLPGLPRFNDANRFDFAGSVC